MFHSAIRVLAYVGPTGFLAAIVQELRGWFARRLLGKRFLKRRVYDYEMWIDLEDPGISRTMLLFGKRELEHRRLMELITSPKSTVFDIGANIGYYAVMESLLVGREGKVIAIEPSPANADLLRRNVSLNGATNVTVLEGAISDAEGERDLYLSRLSNLNTFHPGHGTLTDESRKTRVRTMTVRGLAKEFGPPDLIRMDVEGHEVEILGGMVEGVRAGELAPWVILEVHRNRYSKEHDFEAVLRALFALGYSVRYVGSSQREGTEALKRLGYVGGDPISTDFMERVIFENIRSDHALDLICRTGGVRTVVLAPRGSEHGRP